MTYFLVFEKETGKVIDKTFDQEKAFAYVLNGNGKYDYLSFDERKDKSSSFFLS
ncbi:hypothetical protein IEC97_08420 [Neobacillus cucumis]|uniref:hypothetical protein n=1 Tax=Neobacillus cucumis TaxID=1740721 RepID=UPI0018DF95CC|nr:hypothetical protein [Neobacillus cucumis]MBI0577382.1 hypothetical protein [Neobacillus cucumis]